MGRGKPRSTGADERGRAASQHVFTVNSDPDILNLLRVLFRREGNIAAAAIIGPDTFDRIAAAPLCWPFTLSAAKSWRACTRTARGSQRME